MDHDQGADDPGGKSPGGLGRVFQLVVSVRELDAVGLGELGAEVMAGAGLEGPAVVHQGFDGIGGCGAGKFFLVGLAALDHRDGQVFRAEVRVDVQHLLGAGLGLFHGGVDRMAFLPHEFTGTEEGTGLLLPADDRTPLVVYLGQVAVGLDVGPEEIRENGLGSGTDAEALLQGLAAACGDPGHLGGEAVDQIAFLGHQVLGDQKGHVDILNACLLEAGVQKVLDRFPEGVARGLIDKEALDVGIGYQTGLDHHVCIPLCEILIHGCDFGYQFFLFCHLFLSPNLKFVISS